MKTWMNPKPSLRSIWFPSLKCLRFYLFTFSVRSVWLLGNLRIRKENKNKAKRTWNDFLGCLIRFSKKKNRNAQRSSFKSSLFGYLRTGDLNFSFVAVYFWSLFDFGFHCFDFIIFIAFSNDPNRVESDVYSKRLYNTSIFDYLLIHLLN